MKRSPLRKKSKNTISKLKREVWTVFSKWIRNRDKWTCYTCGTITSGSNLHAGHFVSRMYNATLFDEMNVHAQCYACNILKKGNAGEYAYRLIQQYGQDEFEALVKRGREIKRFTPKELEELKQKYET